MKTFLTLLLLCAAVITARAATTITSTNFALRTNVITDSDYMLAENTNRASHMRTVVAPVSNLFSNRTLRGDTQFKVGETNTVKIRSLHQSWSLVDSFTDDVFFQWDKAANSILLTSPVDATVSLKASDYLSADGTSGASGTSGSLVVKNGLVVAVGATATGGTATNAIGIVQDDGATVTAVTESLNFLDGPLIVTTVRTNATRQASVSNSLASTTGTGAGVVLSNAPTIHNPTNVDPTFVDGTNRVRLDLGEPVAGQLIVFHSPGVATNATISGGTATVDGGTNVLIWTRSGGRGITVSNAENFNPASIEINALNSTADLYLNGSGTNQTLLRGGSGGYTLLIDGKTILRANSHSNVVVVPNLFVDTNLYAKGLPTIGGQNLLAVNAAGLVGKSTFGMQSANLLAPESTDKAISLGDNSQSWSNAFLSGDLNVGGSATITGGLSLGGPAKFELKLATNNVAGALTNFVADLDAGIVQVINVTNNVHFLHATNHFAGTNKVAKFRLRNYSGSTFRLSFPATWHAHGGATTNFAPLASGKDHFFVVDNDGPSQTNTACALSLAN